MHMLQINQLKRANFLFTSHTVPTECDNLLQSSAPHTFMASLLNNQQSNWTILTKIVAKPFA